MCISIFVTKNTVDFSLILYVPDKDGEVEERIILEQQRCNIDDEEIQGDYEIEDLSEEADNGGTKDTEYLLGLRFSNKHSLLRTTKVAYDIKITKGGRLKIFLLCNNRSFELSVPMSQ